MHIPLQTLKHLYNFFFLEYFLKTIKLEISTSIYLGQVYFEGTDATLTDKLTPVLVPIDQSPWGFYPIFLQESLVKSVSSPER